VVFGYSVAILFLISLLFLSFIALKRSAREWNLGEVQW
jgi:hypothetical protein